MTRPSQYACSIVLKKIDSEERTVLWYFGKLKDSRIPAGWERDKLAVVKIGNKKVRNKKRTDGKQGTD